MPGWHATTRALQAAGFLKVAGIAVEQHGDRTRLFMQWKQMAWPVMVDPLNLLEMKAVPVTVLIDEFGIIRKINPSEDDLKDFLATEFESPGRPLGTEFSAAPASPAMRFAIDTVAGNRTDRLDEAIWLMDEWLLTSAENGLGHFRLGVLYRLRYDSPLRQDGDFSKAIEHWSKALALDPNQYIWRRRIQQYGPRLDKPYPFYDWVAAARAEIIARGETPLPLRVEPGGAEIAQPGRTQEAVQVDKFRTHPDPQGRLEHDAGLIRVETTVVSSTDAGSMAYRVHVELRPDENRGAHWNNETDPVSLWLTPDAKWQYDANPVLYPLAPTNSATSAETRHLEFELTPTPASSGDSRVIGGQLFYSVCEGESGTCLFLTQDLSIRLP